MFSTDIFSILTIIKSFKRSRRSLRSFCLILYASREFLRSVFGLGIIYLF